PTPTANLSVPINQVCLGLPITVTATSGNNVFYSFNMGDGVTINNNPPVNYVYSDTGMYAVTLTVTDGNNCSFDTTFNSVFIRPIAIADFTFTQVPLCAMPAQINFINQSVSAGSYQWYFGVTDSSQQTNPVRTYNNDTSFTTTLIANNLYGCKSSSDTLINVYAAPVTNFSASDTVICPGDVVTFTQNSSSNANTFYWNFGNGTTSTLAAPPPQQYNNSGIYSVWLIAGNNGICFDTLYRLHYINVQAKPQAQFSYLSVDTVVNQIMFSPSGYYQFKDLSINANTVFWDFDDGTNSIFHNPLHLYYSSGERCVMLIARNNNECSDTAVTCFLVDLPGTLYLPNSVSPDNGNDEERSFFAKGTSIQNYKLEIFSPFGELVWFCEETTFENGISKCKWQGTDMNGKGLPQGAYVWKVSGTFENGSKLIDMSEKGKLRNTGTVMLLR
ncbi:MAG TPA: PKD domain-containing protein, partial [Bacteroidia bacterium]|nr:PKD domain-containing protein [Bacteroidia bacterium]